MAETGNIALMAEKVSADIFSVFGWEARLLKNQNWECVEQEKHNRRRVTTHPTDAVFRYVDPYSGDYVYVNTDLKSYSKGSIESADLTRTLKSLAHATECANLSEEWKRHYVDDSSNHSVIGMLFVYNHDGEYDKDFEALLEKLPPSHVALDSNHRVGVISPKRVLYLNTIANDILASQGKGDIPKDERYFFYPHLHRHKAVNGSSECATLWSLLSPLIVIGYPGKSGKQCYRAYYDGEGKSKEEFEYLLDFLFRYQIATKKSEVTICLNNPHGDAASHFDRAKEVYGQECWKGHEDTRAKFNAVLDVIKYRSVTQVIKRFDSTELGMGGINADL